MEISLAAHRRALHRIPELGRELPKTRAYIIEQLKGLGCRLLPAPPGGVVAFFDRGKEETAVFRSDMDALPITEETGLDFSSEHRGRMHACGHDGHMAILLGLAQYAARHPEQMSRNLLLIFQPAEETDGGARDICETGVLEQCRATHIFGVHLWPGLPAGAVCSCPGAMMARSSEIMAVIEGQSVHIAKWRQGKDALAAGALFLRKVYDFGERILGKNGVLRFGQMESGTAPNALSRQTVLRGSVRVLEEEVFIRVREGMARIAEEVEQQTGCHVTLSFGQGYPPVKNHPLLFQKASALLGEKLLMLENPVFTAEDFSFYQQRTPGVFFFLGTGEDEPLHSSRFDFDEAALDRGLALYLRLLEI